MANDVEVSAIYLGSFADSDTDETNNSPKFASSLLGTFGGPGTPLSDAVTTLDTDSPRARSRSIMPVATKRSSFPMAPAIRS